MKKIFILTTFLLGCFTAQAGNKLSRCFTALVGNKLSIGLSEKKEEPSTISAEDYTFHTRYIELVVGAPFKAKGQVLDCINITDKLIESGHLIKAIRKSVLEFSEDERSKVLCNKFFDILSESPSRKT